MAGSPDLVPDIKEYLSHRYDDETIQDLFVFNEEFGEKDGVYIKKDAKKDYVHSYFKRGKHCFLLNGCWTDVDNGERDWRKFLQQLFIIKGAIDDFSRSLNKWNIVLGDKEFLEMLRAYVCGYTMAVVFLISEMTGDQGPLSDYRRPCQGGLCR